MSYLPLILRENVHSNLSGEGNFPKINFRKLAANRNKKLYPLYLFLTMVKNVFTRLTNNLREEREPDKTPSVGNVRDATLKDKIKKSS